MQYISMMKPGKPDLPASMTDDDRIVFGKHAEYLRSKFAEDRIIFAGPSMEANGEHFAVVVLSAETKDQAVQIMNADPAVESGLLTSHVTEFEVFLSRKFDGDAPSELKTERKATASICYVEIPAPDIEKAGAFYSSIFGWQIKPSNLSETSYWEFRTGDGQISGGFVQERAPHQGGVLLYLKVEDIESTLRQIEANGGAVTKKRTDIGGSHGFSAFFDDPNGNRMGLYSLA